MNNPIPNSFPPEKIIHDQLIAELFDDHLSQSAREMAARNEIIKLRQQLVNQAVLNADPASKADSITSMRQQATKVKHDR